MNVGAAEIDITPDFEVELSGFAARVQPSVGVLEPIFARAIVIDDGGEKLLWIVCDLLALKRDFIATFRDWAARELDLLPHQVLICCTHTHNAPATVHLNAAGQCSRRYLAFLLAKLEQVALRASHRLEPADVTAARVPLELAVDRRNKPSAHVDPVLWTIGWIPHADRNSFVAALMNYAMHPVALGHAKRRISPDWCGGASRAVSSLLKGSPITLVTNGAAGNLNPPREGVEDDVATGYGSMIGLAAGLELQANEPRPTSLKVRSIDVPIALDVLDADQIDASADAFITSIGLDHAWADAIRGAVSTWRETMTRTIATGGGGEASIELQAIRIGDVNIVAINGELFSRFTALLRERVGENTFVVGYANAAFGYIPTREAYAEGGYEVEQAHFFYNSFRPVAGTLEMLVDRAAELIKSL